MDSFRKFQRENKRKNEQQKMLSEIKSTVAYWKKASDNYLEEAKEAYKSGNSVRYESKVALYRNAQNCLIQCEDMLTNITMALDMQRMQELSSKFVKSLDAICNGICRSAKGFLGIKSKPFCQAVDKQSFYSDKIRSMLQENNIAFINRATSVSDISDSEIKNVIAKEVDMEGSKIGLELEQLEEKLMGKVATQNQTIPQKTTLGNMTIQASTMVQPTHITSIGETITPIVSAQDELSVSKPIDTNVEKPSTPPIVATEQQTINNNDSGKEQHMLLTGDALRPTRLCDYHGQPTVVKMLSAPLQKSKLTGTALPHVLICGSYGQGKTTLAKIIANEMSGNFIEVSSNIKAHDMVETLKNLKPHDVIFVDEVHKLSGDVVESVLYAAIDGGQLVYTYTSAGKTVNMRKDLPPFTFVGATTESGKLLKPFRSKFPIHCELQEYSEDIIASIITNSFYSLGMTCPKEEAFAIARRSRLNPRQANAYVSGISDKVIVAAAQKNNINQIGALNNLEAIRQLNIVITSSDVEQYFKDIAIDAIGLKANEIALLKTLINEYNGGPMGQENIAKALNVSPNVVTQDYEPYLIKLGFINIRPQGRFATEKAYDYLGIPYGGDQKDEDVIEAKISQSMDIPAGNRLMSLLSAPNKVIISEKTLDEEFEDVHKPYSYDSQNASTIVLHGSCDRKILCESKLERRFICYLAQAGLISDARTECLELSYVTGAGMQHKYFPDFVLKLKDGTIAVVEMKNILALGYYLNLYKYEALKAFCNEKGYYYAEIAKGDGNDDYVSVEEIKSRPINEELKKHIYNTIDKSFHGGTGGFFTQHDYELWKALPHDNFNELDVITILLNDTKLYNTDATGLNLNIGLR